MSALGRTYKTTKNTSFFVIKHLGLDQLLIDTGYGTTCVSINDVHKDDKDELEKYIKEQLGEEE